MALVSAAALVSMPTTLPACWRGICGEAGSQAVHGALSWLLLCLEVRTAHEALAAPARRRVRGIAACSLFTALLLMAANIRKIRMARRRSLLRAQFTVP